MLKANHLAACEAPFARYCFGRAAVARGHGARADSSTPPGESHGRLVRRRVFACSEALKGWPGLRTVLASENIRSVTGRAGVSSQIRSFLSSRPADAETLASAIRRHGSIEDNLHWVPEVSFEEANARSETGRRRGTGRCCGRSRSTFSKEMPKPRPASLGGARGQAGTTPTWSTSFTVISCVSFDRRGGRCSGALEGQAW